MRVPLLIITLAALVLAPGQLNARISLLGVKNALVQFALERINVPGSLEITVDRLERVEDDATDLVGLTVADRDGVWLRIDRVSMGWVPRRLLRGQLVITRLVATNVSVLRRPVLGADPAPVAEGARGPVRIVWPRAPLTVAADGLALKGVTIAAGLIADQAVSFDAEGRIRDEGDEQSAAFHLTRTDAIAGQIRLNYLRDFAADTLQLELDADEAPGGLVAALAGLPPGAAAEVHLDGDGPILEWTGDLRADIGDVGTLDGRIAVPSVQPAHVRLDVRALAQGRLQVSGAPLLDQPVDLRADVAATPDGVITLNAFDLKGGLGALTASGRVDVNAERLDVRVDATIPEVGKPLLPDATLRGFRFDGRVAGAFDDLTANGRLNVAAFAAPAANGGEVRVDADVHLTGGELGFTVDGTAASLRADRLDLTAGGPVTLAIAGALNGQKLELARAEVAGPLLDVAVNGEMKLDGSDLRLDYWAEADDLAPVAAAYDVEAAGGFAVEGRVTGSATRPVVTGTAVLTGFAYAGETIGDARLRHTVRLAKTISGEVSVTVETEPYGRIAANVAHFALAGERLTVTGLEASALNVQVRTETPIMVETGSGLTAGEVSWRADSLREIGKLTGTGVSGSGRGALVLRKRGQLQDVQLTAALARVSAGGLSAAAVSGNAAIRDVLAANPGVSGSILAKDAALGGMNVADASVETAGTLASLDVKGALSGTAPDGQEVSADLAANAGLTGPRQTVRVSRLSAAYAGESVRLRQPLVVVIDGSAIRASDIALDIPGGGVEGDVALIGNRLRGTLAADLPDVSLVARLAGLSVDGGALTASALFDTQRSAQIEAAIAGLRSEHLPEGAPGLDAALTGTWDGRTASLEASVDGGFGAPAQAAASIALRPSGRFLPAPRPDAALRGSVRWKGRVESVWAALPAPDHYLEGDADLDLALAGTLENPSLSGNLTLSDGRYENLETGTILADLSAVSEVAPDGAFVVDIVGNDGANAPVTARLAVKDGQLDGTLETRKATLVRRPELEAVMSATIAIAGPIDGPAVSGDVLVNRAEVRLVNALPPNIATLGDVRIKGAPKPRDKPSKDSPIGLDLRIHAPDSVFVRGRGLDSEWRMDIDVSGNTGRPRVRGSIDRVRGQLVLVGRTFALDTGRIAFSGAIPTDPDLDIRLTRQNDGISGGVVVSGRASDPQIDFVSTPALPKGEVMPRLLFGRSQQSLTALQAFELASGIATLLDGSGGRIDQIRSAVGLDVLRLQDDGDGTGVTVGTNLRDGVFVGATQPLDGSAPRVRVEIEVFDNFAVETDVGAQGGTNVGVKWRRDF